MASADPVALVLREAQAAFQSGRVDVAISYCRRALDMAPDRAEAHFNMGACLERKGDLALAASSYRRALAVDPANTTFRAKLGSVLVGLRQHHEAAELYSGGAALQPEQWQWFVGLGRAQEAMGRYGEAASTYEKALRLKPDAQGFVRLASTLLLDRRPTEALPVVREALKLNPDSALALSMMGNVLQELGQFEESSSYLLRALELDPRLTSAYYKLVRIGHSGGPVATEKMEAAMAASQLPEVGRHLHYALGKTYEEIGNFEKSISHFDLANELSREVQFGRLPFPEAELKKMFNLMKSAFTGETMRQWSGLGDPSVKPIFIVGMIRSGTTLVEQILSSHPEVAAAGELTYWLKEGEPILKQVTGGQFNKELAASFQKGYLNLLDRLGEGSVKVTDKMPSNYMLLGLIHLLFPNAKIVHCFRNPVANAFSIWTTPFTDPPKFAYLRMAIVTAFKEYEKLMRHWRTVLPPQSLLEISYEDLVQNPELNIRRLLVFNELEWDDRCLHPEANSRIVSTPSAWQVRQPLYTKSVERWRNFEPWLQEFAELLSPL